MFANFLIVDQNNNLIGSIFATAGGSFVPACSRYSVSLFDNHYTYPSLNAALRRAMRKLPKGASIVAA